MPYAEVSLVLSRAGKVAEAWEQDGAVPGIADLESFLKTSADEIDGALAGRGVSAPIEAGSSAAKSLAGLNADMAILLALPGTYIRDRDAIANLRDEVRARVQAGELALETGTHSAFLLAAQGGSSGSITSLWDPNSPAGFDSPYGRTANRPRIRRGDVF